MESEATEIKEVQLKTKMVTAEETPFLMILKLLTVKTTEHWQMF
jgi:hypothetical protein